jgi:hypothetical protein
MDHVTEHCVAIAVIDSLLWAVGVTALACAAPAHLTSNKRVAVASTPSMPIASSTRTCTAVLYVVLTQVHEQQTVFKIMQVRLLMHTTTMPAAVCTSQHHEDGRY